MGIVSSYIVPHPPLIIPQVGQGREAKIQKTLQSYQEVGRRIAADAPETIILISPHAILYADYFHISPGTRATGNMSEFGAGEVCFDVSYDKELADLIGEISVKNKIDAGGLGNEEPQLDHGTMIPLYFIDQHLKAKYKILRISLSGFSLFTHYQYGKCIRRACEQLGRRVVVVASGDLSHKLKEDGPYGYAKEGLLFDNLAVNVMNTGDFLGFFGFDKGLPEKAAECGLRAFTIMAGALNGKRVKPDFLSYEDTLGVGYAVCCYEILNPDENDVDEGREFDRQLTEHIHRELDQAPTIEDPYIRLAKSALESYIIHGKHLPYDTVKDSLPPELSGQTAGVFVSLHMDGNLRGCMGTIAATTENVAQEILQNAVTAGTRDPRFNPVDIEELAELEYSVDVLGEFEHIKYIAQMDVHKYGIFVSLGERSGLLLPNLPDVTTPKRQLEIALDKAGIKEDEPYHKYRFKVTRHEQKIAGEPES